MFIKVYANFWYFGRLVNVVFRIRKLKVFLYSFYFYLFCDTWCRSMWNEEKIIISQLYKESIYRTC